MFRWNVKGLHWEGEILQYKDVCVFVHVFVCASQMC